MRRLQLSPIFLALLVAVLLVNAKARSVEQSALHFDWLNYAEAAFQQVCEIAGLVGEAGIKKDLPRTQWAAFDRWLEIEKSQPLVGASTLVKADAFCSTETICSDVASWYLSMSPSARIRRDAVFFGMRGMNTRMNHSIKTRSSRNGARDWSDIEADLNAHAIPNQFGAASIERSMLIERLMRNQADRRRPLNYSIMTGSCILADPKTPCIETASRVFNEVSPATLTDRDLRLGRHFRNVMLSAPENLLEVTSDARYSRALNLINNIMLTKIRELEIAAEGAERSDLASFSIGTLESDLRGAVRVAFRCTDDLCIEKHTGEILEFYGARGASFVAAVDFFTDEQMLFWQQYGFFSTAMNYIDALAKQTHTNLQGLYTVSQPRFSECLPPKPYHYFFPKAIANRLKREGYPRVGVAQAVMLSSVFLYQVGMHSPAPEAAQNLANSTNPIYNVTRLDCIFNSVGVLAALEAPVTLDPVATLASMNHFAVGDINQNDLRRMIDAINSMSGSRPRPTAKGLGRIELGGVSIDNAIDMSEKGYGLLARDPQWMLNLQQMHLLEIVEKAAQ